MCMSQYLLIYFYIDKKIKIDFYRSTTLELPNYFKGTQEE